MAHELRNYYQGTLRSVIADAKKSYEITENMR